MAGRRVPQDCSFSRIIEMRNELLLDEEAYDIYDCL